MATSPRQRTPLLHRLDVLGFPTGNTERDINASKTSLGAALTLLVPCALAAYFTAQYIQNLAAPNVSTVTAVDLNALPPLGVSLTCSVAPGGTVDPVCPSADFPGAVPGFQFVDHLRGADAASTCSSLARGSSSRTDASRAWPLRNPRGLLDAYVALGNLSTYLTPAQQAKLPRVPTTYGALVRSFGITTDDLWPGAGLPLPLAAGAAADAGAAAGAWAAALQARPATSVGVDALAAGTADLAGGVRQELGPDTAPAPSAAAAAAVFGPFPACPFPRISSTKSLAAAPATAGVGFLAPLLPGFNWSAAFPGSRFLSVDISAAFGAHAPLRVPIAAPAASATGDELHDLWVRRRGRALLSRSTDPGSPLPHTPSIAVGALLAVLQVRRPRAPLPLCRVLAGLCAHDGPLRREQWRRRRSGGAADGRHDRHGQHQGHGVCDVGLPAPRGRAQHLRLPRARDGARGVRRAPRRDARAAPGALRSRAGAWGAQGWGPRARVPPVLPAYPAPGHGLQRLVCCLHVRHSDCCTLSAAASRGNAIRGRLH